MNTTILMIDDDEHLCNLVKMFFTKEGFTFEAEHSGNAGLKTFQKLAPHLVILDVMLPGMDCGFRNR